MSHDIALEMKNICKYFPGVKALNNVDFTLRKGEIHALMGENGAGKSTLVKVLTGVYKMNSGEIKMMGKCIQPESPQDAQQIGISTVFQEVNLCPNLSVSENLFIGRQPKKNNKIDWKTMNKKSREVLYKLNIDIDVTEKLSTYSVAIQQMVAIARAVEVSSGVLILDEPTSSLDSNEVEELYQIMIELKKRGISIIFITHFIEQVYAISDRITVLRNGDYVGTYITKEISYLDLISKMIGKEYQEMRECSKKSEGQNDGEIFLRANRISKKGKILPMDFNISKGEILGLAGLLGSGRTETAKVIFGIDKNETGNIVVNNKVFKRMYPKKAMENGMAYCPEDRKVEGIIGELSIRENIVLALQAKKGLLNYIPLKEQIRIAREYVDLLKIKTPDIEQRVDKLSGGNQQKVILARWLVTKPKLLILDEPTRGIDIGARTEVQRLILNLALKGMTILLISSEIEELVKCCSRILVLRDRKLIGEISGEEISEKEIMRVIAEGGRV